VRFDDETWPDSALARCKNIKNEDNLCQSGGHDNNVTQGLLPTISNEMKNVKATTMMVAALLVLLNLPTASKQRRMMIFVVKRKRGKQRMAVLLLLLLKTSNMSKMIRMNVPQISSQ
jgi:hypothetical protein